MAEHASCHHLVYRLSCADFDALIARAGGRCEICRRAPAETPRGLLCIDHDERYGYAAVRGLLCDRCNSLMSFVDRGLKRDRRAVAYLRNAWFVRRRSS